MINLGKIKYEKCQPPFLRIPAPEPYFFHFSNTTPFFNFSESPPVGEVIKIYFLPPLKMGGKGGGGAGGPNYAVPSRRTYNCAHVQLFHNFIIKL